MATTVAVAPMKAAQVSKPGADFEIVEREIPKPGAGQVRIKVQACGVCHSDVLTKEGAWPGIQYPRVPGHEVAGIIDEVGAGVSAWKKGQRVGVGWHGGQDNTCRACRRGDFRNCRNLKIPGISYDGGYQQYMVAPVEALVGDTGKSEVTSKQRRCSAPELPPTTRCGTAVRSPATLLRCRVSAVWVTSEFNSRTSLVIRSRRSGAGPKTRRSQRNSERACTSTAKRRTRHEALQKLGGAQVILATAPSSKAMSELIDGLGPNGKLMVIGAAFDPIEVTPIQLITGSRTIQGWAAGTPADSEDTLRFAELTGVRPMIETYPLEKAAEAYARMMSGKAAVPRRSDDVKV